MADRAALPARGDMKARRSLLWPSLFWLLLFLVLVALGTWQIQRLHWKEGLIAELRATVSGPPSALPDAQAALNRMEFHHVKFAGKFLNQDELYRHAIAADGTPGVHVVTPFQLDNGDIVFVDRGFVPEDRRDPATRAAGQIAGATSVTGLLRLPETASSWFTPANEPGENLWFTMDLPAMAAARHLTHVMPFYVDADATPVPGGYPIGGQTNPNLPNDHLQYALTWYGLAGLCVIYYGLFVRRWRKEKDKGERLPDAA
jgi:surfeit locus 1 family protein